MKTITGYKRKLRTVIQNGETIAAKIVQCTYQETGSQLQFWAFTLQRLDKDTTFNATLFLNQEAATEDQLLFAVGLLNKDGELLTEDEIEPNLIGHTLDFTFSVKSSNGKRYVNIIKVNKHNENEMVENDKEESETSTVPKNKKPRLRVPNYKDTEDLIDDEEDEDEYEDEYEEESVKKILRKPSKKLAGNRKGSKVIGRNRLRGDD